MANLQIKVFNEDSKNLWDDFINNSYGGDILQFWGWGETKKDQGWKPLRLGVVDENNNLVFAAQCLIKKAGFLGNYIYIPHGPVFKNIKDLKDSLPFFVDYLKSKSKELDIFGIEIEPRFGKLAQEEIDPSRVTENIKPLIDPEILTTFINNKFFISGRNMQPVYKIYYDLSLPDEKLFSMMKKNTRYNIGLAERKGVNIEKIQSDDMQIPDKISKFYSLMLETQKRAKGYPIRPKSTFDKLMDAFKGSENIALFEASYGDDLIATNISQRTKYWSSSFYAASNRLHSEKKAMYLLRWKSIQWAKEYGSKLYDFWGIIPDSKQHQGYSDTKLSFGGVRINNYGILVLPFNRYRYFIWNNFLKSRKHIPFLK